MSIKNFYPRDERAIRAMANCGFVPIADLQDDGLRKKRINDYIKSNIAVLEQSKNQDNQFEYALKLTAHGKDMARKLYGIEFFQKPTSIQHDGKLSAIYHDYSDDERLRWKNESELKANLIADYGGYDGGSNHLSNLYDIENDTISVCDASIDGYYIEVITDNYGRVEIEEKENYGLLMHADIHFF